MTASDQQGWPDWWRWELECSNPHLAKRMADRSFNEIALREMLEQATAFRPDAVPGRFLIATISGGSAWEVIVEPDEAAQLLIVVTAYTVTE